MARDGLEIRTTKKFKSFNFRWRDAHGRNRRLKLGDDRHMSLKEAKLAAAQALVQVAKGDEPTTRKKTLRAEARAHTAQTLGDVVDLYLPFAEKRLRAGSYALYRSRLLKHVKPELGEMRLEAITSAHVQALVDKIGADGRERTANHSALMVGILWTFAKRRLKLKLGKSPTEDLELFVEKSRERVLSDAELRQIWTALESPADAPSALSAGMACCLAFCAVSLQRIGECAGLHESEIDLAQRLWVLPGARSKNGAVHVIPLSELALEIIKRTLALRQPGHGGFMFPGSRRAYSGTEEARPIARHSASQAFQRLCAGLRIKDARPHDLRRSGATLLCERCDIPQFTVSAVLGHLSETRRGVTGKVYNRSSHLPQKRQALESWAQLLREIVTNEEAPTNVVKLAARQ